MNLTNKQKSIMDLKAEGQTNKEIAFALQVTESTIQQHIQAAHNKIGGKTPLHSVTIHVEARLLETIYTTQLELDALVLKTQHLISEKGLEVISSAWLIDKFGICSIEALDDTQIILWARQVQELARVA